MQVKIQNNRKIITPEEGKIIYNLRTQMTYSFISQSVNADSSQYIEIDKELNNIALSTAVKEITSTENEELIELKNKLIDFSKIKLTEFLENNPVLFEGKYYSVTSASQGYLDTLILATEDAINLNIDFTPMWNDINGMREVWQLEQLKKLRIVIQSYILPFIIQQQQIEKEILASSTIAEAYRVNIGYHL